ncbi:hypothetical protein [Vibrio sp. D431a]|uniref:hypothetical protein n=1 Tax=Vibrio sp. D431a TaxID=2837388 RepID=UPI002553B5CE|nr:hypothetical protein [Vibrio sp. D431a]MDK9793933.1 hypothetical protein [Vibrio sp. D431a]
MTTKTDNKPFPIYGYLSPKRLAKNHDAWLRVTKVQLIGGVIFIVAPILSFIWLELGFHNTLEHGREFGLALVFTGIAGLLIGFIATLLMFSAVYIVEAECT